MRFGILALLLFFHVRLAASETLPIEKIEFHAKTNLSAISVKGKNTSAVTALIEMNDQEIRKLSATLDVKNLETGLSLRDEHMRDRIFKTEDGKYPEIRFNLTSPFPVSGTEQIASSTISVRGKEIPFKPLCVAKKNADRISIDCKSELKLSDLGITPPSHLGVKVQDTVTLTVSTNGKLSP